MKHILITYRFEKGSQEDWHKEVARFITALKNDSELKDKITYRVMKSTKSSEYYHLATVADDSVAKMLNQRDFFKRYTDENDVVSDGTTEVIPLELIASTE